MEFGQHVSGKQVRVVNGYVVAVRHLVVEQSQKTARARSWLPEACVTRPHAVVLAELMVQTDAAFVLTSNSFRRIQTVELRVAGEVGGRKQLLRVVDHVLVNHGGRDF